MKPPTSTAKISDREARQSARDAGLRYRLDAGPGISRKRQGKDFRYFLPNHKPLTGDGELRRVRSLAVPPAWTDVWISPDSQSHLQATGRDARGRKQYRYHRDWRSSRDETKFERMLDFGRALPGIRKKILRDLRRPGLDRRKVLAALIRLLEISGTRIGNEEYVTENHSYGLTTLRNRHATVRGDTIRLRFRGKAGIEHDLSIEHPTLARLVRRCQHLPGQKLFEYIEGETVRSVGSEDVNEYIGELSRVRFTTKDFRTWKASVLAVAAFCSSEDKDMEDPSKRTVTRVLEEVARHLGNTPAICRKCYIHPTILESYLAGTWQALPLKSVNGDRLLECENVMIRLLKIGNA